MKGNEDVLLTYIQTKGYSYKILDPQKKITDQIDTDFIIYQRPYNEMVRNHMYFYNWRAVMVHILYGFHSIIDSWTLNLHMAQMSWQDYYENDLCAEPVRLYSRNKGRNVVVTGSPTLDALFRDKTEYDNPWPENEHRKKIIWAPHHSIADLHVDGLAYGTFLEIADDMLKIASDYKQAVYFVFKPHPQLYKNLIKIWGKERTDLYYKKWQDMPNTQIQSGEYIALFKHSDAMIHDCASFTMEYLATGNPVLYVVGKNHLLSNINECAKRSFNLHYHADNSDKIRTFINNVIDGLDPLRDERLCFVDRYLRSPHGKTASENIINSLLGVEEYSDC